MREWGGWECVCCACDNEERDHGLGSSVNTTMMSETLEVVRIVEVAESFFQFITTDKTKTSTGGGKVSVL